MPNAQDFDRLPKHDGFHDTLKWQRFDPDVLPMWIADTDFAVPESIVTELAARLQHPDFGYTVGDVSVRESIVRWLDVQHGWSVSPEDIVFLPGALPGLSMGLNALVPEGANVACQMPVYGPIHSAPGYWGQELVEVPLEFGAARYGMGALEEAISRSSALMLCNPHNPSGHVYTRSELGRIAEACERNDTLIISDDVHCDMVFNGHTYIPIASLSPEVAARTITLMSAGKTFNISGMKLAFAIVPNATLRAKFIGGRSGLVPRTDNLMGLVATEAAFNTADDWRQSMVRYLDTNCEYLANVLRDRIPAIRFIKPEASFLAWLDCRDLGIKGDPAKFFLRHAKVAFTAGPDFGRQGEGFVRMNFGCARSQVDEAVHRMAAALG